MARTGPGLGAGPEGKPPGVAVSSRGTVVDGGLVPEWGWGVGSM